MANRLPFVLGSTGVTLLLGVALATPAYADAEWGTKYCSSQWAVAAKATGNGSVSARAVGTVNSGWYYDTTSVYAFSTSRSGSWRTEGVYGYVAMESYGYCDHI